MASFTRRHFLGVAGVGAASALLAGCAGAPLKKGGDKRMNVLFIAVDDLRPTLGCYGAPIIQTPNIDGLAARGVVFNHAYCQQAVCSPSRTSLMTGLRPDTTKIYDLATHFRKNLPNVVTLAQHFKNNGYHTQAFSKIYHGALDDPISWSVPHDPVTGASYVKPENLQRVEENKDSLRKKNKQFKDQVLEKDPNTGATLKVKIAPKSKGESWECADVPDNGYKDGVTAEKAIECLRDIKDKPFFLAVGFLKPHLPFNAPKKYFDMYPPESIPLAPNPFAPKDVPEVAMTNSGELRAYSDIPKDGPVGDVKARELVRAYYAAASYTDAQIGKVIAELDRLGLRDNTIIVLWGDHGWQLGEHSIWCKHTNFENATNAPLLISDPRMRQSNVHTDGLVEFVDIYPTLVDLCGLPAMSGLEGCSMVPLMKEPGRPWKKAAFSQYPRPNDVMGHTMRTERYRYTEWVDKDGKMAGVELYDHKEDPAENVNLANQPDRKADVATLSKMLNAGWRECLPAK